jgi:hypothetical protein
VGQIFLYSLGLFWLVVVYWVWLDSGERTSNRNTRLLYILLVITLNVIGWIIYLIIRPSQTIEEIYWSDLERRYLKYETAELGDCPRCGTQLYPGYTFCPSCRYQLKRKCTQCDVYIDRKNKHCPYCGKEMRKRVSPDQESPSQEVMEKQIQATKDEATEIVETKKTRYTIQKDFSVKVGDTILKVFGNIKEGFNNVFAKAKDTTNTLVVKAKEVKVNGDSNNKKRKNKKKKKRR